MPKAKGAPKTGGRVKGTPNKVTAITKSVISKMLAEYQESGLLCKDFAELEAKDRLMIFEKLLNYTLPKMQSVTADITTTDAEKRISERLAELVDGDAV